MAGKIVPKNYPDRFISNDEARKFLDEVDVYLNNTGTRWSSLCNMVGVSQSVRSSIRTDGNRMRREVRDRFVSVMAENPKGVMVNLMSTRQFLPEAETIVLAAEIREYLDRTGTLRFLLAKSVGREESTLSRMLDSPLRVSASLAARYRRVMFNHPDGIPLRECARRAPAPAESMSTDRLLERRGEADRQREQRYAALNAESIRKYGKPLGRPLSEMAA